MGKIDQTIRYFEFLKILINDNVDIANQYNKLLKLMFTTKYYWSVPLDENRNYDALKLRENYSNEHCTNCLSYFLDGEASVLEVLVAMCVRCENEITCNDDFGNRTFYWFWTIVSNLRLFGNTDDDFDEEYCKNALTRFLDRTYEKDGIGGPFFIKKVTQNMTQLDLWYQFMLYLAENFKE